MQHPVKRARRRPSACLTDGGNPALNFINTHKTSSKGQPIELLTNYSIFLSWCEQTQLISLERYTTLYNEQHCFAHEAELVYCTAKQARECLDEIFNTLIRGHEVHPMVLDRFNGWAHAIRPHLRYENGIGGPKLYWHNIDEELNLPFWLIISEACRLLDSGNWRYIKQCPVCRGLFMDNSRRTNRVWCNARTCGTVKKSKRYYAMKIVA